MLFGTISHHHAPFHVIPHLSASSITIQHHFTSFSTILHDPPLFPPFRSILHHLTPPRIIPPHYFTSSYTNLRQPTAFSTNHHHLAPFYIIPNHFASLPATLHNLVASFIIPRYFEPSRQRNHITDYPGIGQDVDSPKLTVWKLMVRKLTIWELMIEKLCFMTYPKQTYPPSHA